MKTKILFFLILLTLYSNAQNRSFSPVLPDFLNAVPTQQFSGGEIFRFGSGIVTQLDAGSNFDLSSTSPLNSRWFSLGGINTGPGRRAYGLRFQADAKALTFGYQNVNDPLNINPRIEWIGTGASLGNLEFGLPIVLHQLFLNWWQQ